MADMQPWLTRWKAWIAIALGGAVAALAGALIGWRPAASGAAPSPEVARQIAEFRNLRDGIRGDLDELKAELAKRTAAPAPQGAANPPPEPKPASPRPPDEPRPNAPPPDEKLSAEKPADAAPALKAVEAALDQSDVEQAIKLLVQAAEKAAEPDRSRIEELLRQAREALPKSVLSKLQQSMADANNDQIEQCVASGELPAEWMQEFTDRHVANAYRKAAVKLLPIAWHNRELTHFNQRAVRTLEGSYREYMNHMPRMFLFRDLAILHRQGKLDAASVKQVADLYGAYGAESFLPALRGLLVAGMETDSDNYLRALPLADCEDAAVRGAFDLKSCTAMFAECRRLAPEHYQPIDAPHPLAGRWRGKENWQIAVDIPQAAVRYVNAKWKTESNLTILKVGADYVVGFGSKAGRLTSVGRSSPGIKDPFQFEKLAECDGVGHGRDEPDGVIALTLLVASPETKTMDAYRRLEPAEPFLKRLFDGDVQAWRELSDVKRFRLFERYRQATAPASR